MVNTYINLNGRHSSFLEKLDKIDINEVKDLKKSIHNILQFAITSDDLLEETKKNLSDLESSSRPIPKLIVVESENFQRITNLINDRAHTVGESPSPFRMKYYVDLSLIHI